LPGQAWERFVAAAGIFWLVLLAGADATAAPTMLDVIRERVEMIA
jgi:hypothetical protein